jgi:hypothetical protein
MERDELLMKLQEFTEPGALLAALTELGTADSEMRKNFVQGLAAAHNQGHVDLVSEFIGLNNDAAHPDFFMTRQIFVEALAELDADPVAVAKTTAHLVMQAGHDLAANWPLNQFRTFLEKDPKRPIDVLAAIQTAPASLAILLPVTAAAGFSSDRAGFIDQLIRLSSSQDEVLQRMAIAAFANVPLETGETEVPAKVMATLEALAAKSAQEGTVAAILSATVSISLKGAPNLPRLIEITRLCLEKGGQWALGVAAESFATNADKLPLCVLEVLSTQLKARAQSDEGILSCVDMGVSTLLESDRRVLAVDLLEALLMRLREKISIKDFSTSQGVIAASVNLRSFAVTRWLNTGEHPLCEAAASVLQHPGKMTDDTEADLSQIAIADVGALTFLARKTVSYLFFTPVAAASIIISLMRVGAIEPLKQLLLYPLLLNYTGSVCELLQSRLTTETSDVADALRECLEAINAYLAALEPASKLKELRVGEEQRAIFNKLLSENMSKSFESATAQMPLLGMIKRQVVLYGRGSVQHVLHADGSTHRADMMFKTKGTEFMFPRMSHIDELGLNILMTAFRAEKRAK